jgi:RNA polymerase sigma-70 factor (ECF subfamily)
MSAEASSSAATDDEAVVRRVLGGDTEAFALLVERHEAAVWRIVAAGLGERGSVENLVQQCFVSAYETLGRYRPGHDFGAWLRGIARNLAREELRRLGRESRRLSSYRAYLLALYEDDAAAGAEEDRLARALARCREGLAPPAAQALSLRYDRGLDLAAVAAALGRTLVATRQLLFRTRLALRLCVEAEPVPE